MALSIQYDVGLYTPWEEIIDLVSSVINEVAFLINDRQWSIIRSYKNNLLSNQGGLNA